MTPTQACDSISVTKPASCGRTSTSSSMARTCVTSRDSRRRWPRAHGCMSSNRWPADDRSPSIRARCFIPVGHTNDLSASLWKKRGNHVASQPSLQPGTILLTVGTKRGLFFLTSPDRQTWQFQGPFFQGSRVFNAAVDKRAARRRISAAVNGDFFGSFVHYSDDFGETWQDPARGVQFPEGGERKLENIWVVEPGRADEPESVYVGVAPASLWESHDGGETWQMNEALESHPTPDRWNPGAGGPCLHTIVEGMARQTITEQFTVYRTTNSGETWDWLTNGLPSGPAVGLGVLRHGMCADALDPVGVYVGTNTGQLFATADRGDSWRLIADFLPSIYSVRATII